MDSACPPADALLEFAAGRLSEDAQATVETHIDSCVACRASLSALARNDPTPNKTFGRYELETVIGSGGMGIVYRAWDPQLARLVAIKVVKHAGADSGLRTRLVREAQSLARLSHANVCHVYDVGTEGDEVWVAMELIDGQTLRQWAADARPREEQLEVLLGAAEGIAAAHASGLIHRDIKPENVLVTKDGRPVVTDFGLARVDLPVDPNASTVSGDPMLTATGAIVGTPAYLAPEQLTGDTLDARVDQFAWATMAWELLTGVRPFPIVAAIRLDAIRAGLTAPPSLPRPVATALIRAMSLAPRDRFPSMRELIDALRAPPAPARRPRLPIVIAAGAAVLAAGATVIAWQALRAPDAPAAAAVAPSVPDAGAVVVAPPADAAIAPAPPPPDAAAPIVEAPRPKAAKIAPKAAPPPRAGSQAATTAPPQPAATPRSVYGRFSTVRAHATMMTFCKVPIDPKRPAPALGKYGVIDWGTVARREIVTATLVDRQLSMLVYEVRGHRAMYRFNGDLNALGVLDVPVGQLVALCIDPGRPEKVEIYQLPAGWKGGLDSLAAALPLGAPPRVGKLSALAPLHVHDTKLRSAGAKGKLDLAPAAHYLVRARVEAADGARWSMGNWWIEVPKVPGADLVAAGKRLWFVIAPPALVPGPEGAEPRLVAKAVMVLDELFPH